ncbi:MAG: M28 family metallopeptidase [Vicinamibacteria bacterium]
MRTARRLSALALLAAFPATPTLALAADTAKTPSGYTKATADANAAFEKIFLDTPTPENARRWLSQLTEDPHVAGTPAEKKVADWVNAKLKEFGLETEVVKYDVFLNHPKSVSLKMVEPRVEELSLREDNFPGDKDSTPRGEFPAFHGYGASGKANGEVVYVNYGSPADHERLKGMGISVVGKIVLVKYGGAFRGLKVKEAQERGAIGVLIYSDPADDGYMKGDVYPNGPMRPPSSLQRGSVQFLSIQPGDPSTPDGFPSVAGAKRITRDQMTNVPKIPSLPISYREAEKLLTNLGGPRVPNEWQGGLPFSYHIGPGGAAVEMDVQMDEGLKPIYNIIAKIPGTTDQVVVVGNHRDAWTPGAVDPNSGTAAMLEAARGLGAALKAGWKPKRTLLLCSWDAEEYGLVGSTEWAEENAAMLQSKAVAYFNMDVAVTGPNFDSGGTPSLRDAVREAAGMVPEPRKGGTVGAAWEAREKSAWAAAKPVHLDTKDSSFELQLGRLGSGSDYTVFVDHLGIPSTDGGFSGAYGVYHSVYDNFYWMSHFGDPEFIYHQAAARYLGLLAFRTATADVAPLRFSNYGDAMKDDLDDIRVDVVRRARSAGASPFDPDFTSLSKAVADLDAAGKAVDAATDAVLAKGDAATFAKMSDALTQVERAFLNKDGLPGRPWFKHQLIGPGLTTGYAPWPFPALREAVEKKDKAMFDTEAKRIVAALDAGTARLKATAAIH